MPRRASARRVRGHRTYTVAEAARCVGVHPRTVSTWIRDGLPVLKERRPILIKGSDLRSYLDAKRLSRRRPLRLGEIYCLPCREPKRPAGAMVDFIPEMPTSGTLRGICPDCQRLMHRKVKRTSLDRVAAGLDVALASVGERIGNMSVPLVNLPFSQGDKSS